MPSQLEMYKAHQAELVKKYAGQIIAVKDGEYQGSYGSKVEALRAMQEKNFAPGSFLIIRCTAGDEEYTRRFRSRVFLTENSTSACS